MIEEEFLNRLKHQPFDSSVSECSGKDGDNSDCWEGYNDQPYAYILSMPMTAALTVSTNKTKDSNLTSAFGNQLSSRDIV